MRSIFAILLLALLIAGAVLYHNYAQKESKGIGKEIKTPQEVSEEIQNVTEEIQSIQQEISNIMQNLS